MKTTSIVLIAMLSPLVAFSQLNSSFDFIAGIESSYRYNEDLYPLFCGNGQELRPYGDVARSHTEDRKIGWRFGFNYTRSLFDSWNLKYGLRMMNAGFTNKEYDYNDGQAYQRNYDFYFLEIPIGIKNEFGSGKVVPFLEFGLAPTFLIGSNIKTETTEGFNKSKMDDLAKVHMVGYLSYGFSYRYNENSAMFIQPVFRYHITTLQKDSYYKDQLYSIGLEFGLRKILK